MCFDRFGDLDNLPEIKRIEESAGNNDRWDGTRLNSHLGAMRDRARDAPPRRRGQTEEDEDLPGEGGDGKGKGKGKGKGDGKGDKGKGDGKGGKGDGKGGKGDGKGGKGLQRPKVNASLSWKDSRDNGRGGGKETADPKLNSFSNDGNFLSGFERQSFLYGGRHLTTAPPGQAQPTENHSNPPHVIVSLSLPPHLPSFPSHPVSPPSSQPCHSQPNHPYQSHSTPS